MAEEVGKSESLVEVPANDPIPPAPAADEQKTVTVEGEVPPVVETPEQQEVKKQSKFQRRLERQKTARIQAETEAKLLRERVATLEAQSKPKPDTGEPKREQYEDDEAYLRAFVRFEAKQEAAATLKAEREASQGNAQQQQVDVGRQQIAKDWIEREKAFTAVTKDYEEVVTSFVEEDLPSFSQPAKAAIVESEVGPQVLYHLATNADEAERIAGLSPTRQVAELGKLEATLAAPAKKPSNAPAPIKPVGQGRSTPAGYSENMTDSEYKEWRKGQGARWAR